MDLAEGHRAALNCLLAEALQLITLNLGSGQGQSVLEVLHAMEAASGRSIPYAITDSRPGDAAISDDVPIKLLSAWAGAPDADSKTSAATVGPGSSRTPRDMHDGISWY